MAELHVQRKRNNNAWILIVLLIIIIAGAVYYYFNHYQKDKPIPGTNRVIKDSSAFEIPGYFSKTAVHHIYMA